MRMPLVISAMAVMLLGCVTPGQDPGLGMSASVSVPSTAKVGFAVAYADPAIHVDRRTTTPGSDFGPAGGALRGALGGAGFCARFTVVGGPVGLVLAVFCLPVGVGAGAIAGASVGADNASRAGAPVNVERETTQVATTSTRDFDLSTQLRQAISRYAATSRLSGLTDFSEQAGKSPEREIRYAGGADYIVELAVTDLKVSAPVQSRLYQLEISTRGRLMRTKNSSVVDEFSKTAHTDLFSVEEWTDNQGRLIDVELKKAFDEIAKTFIDEWIVIYREERAGGNAQTQDSGELNIRDYVLRPIDPPARKVEYSAANPLMFGGNQEPGRVPSLTPTLTWEPLPRSLPRDPNRVRNVIYDVKIYGGRSPGQKDGMMRAVIPYMVIRSYSDLSSPAVQVENGVLGPCTYYFWTIRARFELDGRPRMTEWAWVSGAGDPAFERRSRRPWWAGLTGDIPAYYDSYVFKTPNAAGGTCGR